MFNHPSKLKQQLLLALKNKGEHYKARTRYIDKDNKPVYINRLILEDSPYLLQHAHNPVDWYPWGNEAFSTAKEQNKPVFLSIGYSTCHWCHVMEEESFDNEDVAKHMNEHFICIKVDRELHPDVDSFYMTAVMMMQGNGGWPMSSFLTPDRKPFFGGTYYQASQFIALMTRVNEAWHKQHDDVLEQADAFSQQVSNSLASRNSMNEIGTNVIEVAAQTVINQYDSHYGGFGQAPKFPNEPFLYFLLEYAIYSGKAEILNIVSNTLHIQGCGGIYDQIAGGFHRYATDRNWLVPHFEKMLYNQANLSRLFAQTYLLTGEEDFKRIACETLDYVIREMTNKDGAFYSATDADSEGEEGLFFIWDKSEIESLLCKDAEEFIQLYQITDSGNFEGKNIPNLNKPLAHYAQEHDLDYQELLERLNRNKKCLWEAREKRIPPLRDDKVITGWNGMMIKAFAYIGHSLNRDDYIEHAITAANAILKINRTDDDELSRASLDGQASILALQEDYAYLAEALLQIYDATTEKHWLEQSQILIDEMIDRFWDDTNGGFFMGAAGKDSLLPTQAKEIRDNATASGNSVALRTLIYLARRTGSQQYRDYAQQLIRAYSDDISQRPYICAYLMCGFLEMHTGQQSSYQWCAEGNVLLSIKTQRDTNTLSATISIKMSNDWHLNAIHNGKDIAPLLIETDGTWQIDNLVYPAAINKTLGFQPETTDVYEGDFEISFDLSNKNDGRSDFPNNLLKLHLKLQACDDHRCLAQECIALCATI